MFTEWREGCITKSGEEMCDSSILKSDLNKPKLLEPAALCSALCKFITEIRKTNDKDYPPQSVRGIVTAIQRYLKNNRIYWILLPK